MRIIFPIIIFIIVALTSTWLIVMFIDMPAILLSPSFYNYIRNIPYIELQILYLLGGDPLHSSNPNHRGLLLNFNGFPLFNVMIWFFSGIVAGIFTGNYLKGLLTGLNAVILIAVISWIFYWGSLYGFDVSVLLTGGMMYQLSLYLIGGLKSSWLAIIGGLIGSILGKKLRGGGPVP